MTKNETTIEFPERVVIYAGLLCSLSLPLAVSLLKQGYAGNDGTVSGFFVTMNLFVGQDMWIGPFMGLTILLSLKWRGPLKLGRGAHNLLVVPVIALSAVMISIALTFLAHHNYPLSLDEFIPTFQAAIFRSGQMMAPLSEVALELNKSLQPHFIYVDETRQVWIQHYRPVHAAILSFFPESYAQALAHGILTGITVIAIADIAGRLFPDRTGAPILGALLLLSSPQVLLTSASGFAFTTHLAFNTVWLAFFLRGTWPAHIAAALVGFFALGIHQVHVHAIYVFPFGIAMLLGYFGSRWKTLPYIVAYSLGVPLWVLWPELATWVHTGDVTALPRRLLDIEYVANYINFDGSLGELNRKFSLQFLNVNLMRFLQWMSPAVVLLLVASPFAVKRLGLVPLICAVGFAFTVVMSHTLLPNQMHTIGSRYYHAAIANIVVVCVAVFYAFGNDERLRRATVVLIITGGAVFLPWRAWQVHEKVAPRAEMQRQLEAMDVDSVIVERSGWFLADFVRNDPFLRNRPVFYVNDNFDDDETAPLLSDGPRAVVSGEDLIDMGLPVGTFLEPDLSISLH